MGPSPDEATGPLLYGADLGVGAQIGDWIVDELRGRGGFATVYRARHYRSGQPVALKVLHDALTGDAGTRKRFLREAEAIQRLQHPAIVRLLDLGEFAAGRPFLVIEWLAGRTLDERLRTSGPLPLDESLALIEQLAGALAAAHAVGIVHRDLKTHNVMLLGEPGRPTVKLLDFGIAKLADDQIALRERLTSTGMRVGSPHCMAPEQILGRPVDARTDVYALGVLVFHLLTGRPPFRGGPLGLEELHLRGPVPRVSQLAPVPPAIDEPLRRAMAKEPADRPPTVAALVAELQAAASGAAPVAAAPAPEVDAAAARVLVRGHAFLASDDADDEAFDDLDEVVADIAAACAAAGLATASDAPGSIAASRALPDDADGAREVRRELVAFAVELAARLRARPRAHAAVRVALSLHVLTRDPTCGDTRSIVPGTSAAADALLVATDAVLEGLDAAGTWRRVDRRLRAPP